MESPTCGKTALIHQMREILTSKPTFIQSVSEKLLKNGEHKSPPEHSLNWIWTENQQCGVAHFLAIFRHPVLITNKTNTRRKRLTESYIIFYVKSGCG